MQRVITAKEAKQITRGRTPLVAFEYERAVEALEACSTFEETKYWQDAHTAYAAYSKMKKDDVLARKLAIFNARIYRRLGELGRELKPPRPSGQVGREPGAYSFLRDKGMSKYDAQAALRISRVPAEQFETILEAAHIPPPARIIPPARGAWTRMGQESGIYRLVAFATRVSPCQAANGVERADRERARKIVQRVMEWLDEFERRLPKEKT